MDEAITYFALEIVVSREQQSPGHGEGDRRDAAENLIAL